MSAKEDNLPLGYVEEASAVREEYLKKEAALDAEIFAHKPIIRDAHQQEEITIRKEFRKKLDELKKKYGINN